MRRTPRLVLVGLLCLAFGISGAPGQAQQPVDFERETHFRCYMVAGGTTATFETVTLVDQFLPATTRRVHRPAQFCAPTSKDGLPILEPDEHLTMYRAARVLDPHLILRTEDQFGLRSLTVTGAVFLLVPTQKLVDDHRFPERLNHYWCYRAFGEPVDRRVRLRDQFGTDSVRVRDPFLFCNPVEKRHADVLHPIKKPEVHLTCYLITSRQPPELGHEFGIHNQFVDAVFRIGHSRIMCVPSAKLEVTPAR